MGLRRALYRNLVQLQRTRLNSPRIPPRHNVCQQYERAFSCTSRTLTSIKVGDVELTSERYKGSVERGDYGHLASADVAFFRDLLGELLI